ncbi:MAG: hypothetical protein ACRDQD_10350 [Nocardioidaceae bacterium]
MTAIVASSIVVLTVRAKAKVIERDEAKILAALEELNGGLAELAEKAHSADEAKVLAGLEELNGRLARLAQNAHPADEGKVLAALRELNGRLARLANTIHPSTAGNAPWPQAPLVRPPRNWEDEV